MKIVNGIVRDGFGPVLNGFGDGMLVENGKKIKFDDFGMLLRLPTIEDRISKQALSVTMPGSRPDGEGNLYAENQPVIDSQGWLHSYGGYTILNEKSNDISDGYWFKDPGVIISGTSGFKATVQYDDIYKSITTVDDGTLYTISLYAYVVPGGRTTGFGLRHINSKSPAGNATYITLSETRKRYFATVLGKAGGGTVEFGFFDANTSNFVQVYIDTINITASTYAMPPAINTTAGTLAVPANFPDGTQQLGFQITPDPVGGPFTGPGGTRNMGLPLALDALDGAVTGSELVVNGDFANGLTGWSNGTGLWSASAGKAVCNAPATSNVPLNQSIFISGVDDNIKVNLCIDVTITAGTVSYYSGAAFVPLINGSNDIRFVKIGEYALINIRGDNFVGSIDNVSVKAISPGQGEADFQIMPMFNAANVTTGTHNILSLNSTTPGWIYYDAVNQLIKMTDGTNMATVAWVPVAGQAYNLKAIWGNNTGQKMQLILDGVAGTQVTHADRFPVSTRLSKGFNAAPWIATKLLSIKKTPTGWA